MENINEFKKKYFNDWADNIANQIETKIKNTILSRQGSDLVMNFSPTVSILHMYNIKILHNVNYFYNRSFLFI